MGSRVKAPMGYLRDFESEQITEKNYNIDGGLSYSFVAQF